MAIFTRRNKNEFNVMEKNICAMLIAAATAGAVLPAEAIPISFLSSLQNKLDLGGEPWEEPGEEEP